MLSWRYGKETKVNNPTLNRARYSSCVKDQTSLWDSKRQPGHRFCHPRNGEAHGGTRFRERAIETGTFSKAGTAVGLSVCGQQAIHPLLKRPDSYPHLFWFACRAQRDGRG